MYGDKAYAPQECVGPVKEGPSVVLVGWRGTNLFVQRDGVCIRRGASWMTYQNAEESVRHGAIPTVYVSLPTRRKQAQMRMRTTSSNALRLDNCFEIR